MSPSRLRKFRKSADLTQQEVATLVGYASQRAYSDMELGIKRPALGTAMACSIVFDAPLHELFPALAKLITRDILARARKLELKDSTERDIAAAHVAGLMQRLEASSATER